MMNAIITGATKGIGRATAELLAAKGVNLCLTARSEADLQQLKKDLTAIDATIGVHCMPADLSDKQQVTDFGNECLKHFSSVDLLINNAGIFLPGNLHEEPDGQLEYLLNLNLVSVYHLTRLIIPVMKQVKKGHIFNMCSVASLNAYDQGGSYALSKYALLGFSKNLRHELKQFNIRVTALLPGAVFTPSWDGTQHPESRFIPAEDIAKIIWNTFELSERTDVEEILIRPMLGDL